MEIAKLKSENCTANSAYSEMRYSPFAIVPLEICLAENLKF
jgi:hypothetical protein